MEVPVGHDRGPLAAQADTVPRDPREGRGLPDVSEAEDHQGRQRQNRPRSADRKEEAVAPHQADGDQSQPRAEQSQGERPLRRELLRGLTLAPTTDPFRQNREKDKQEAKGPGIGARSTFSSHGPPHHRVPGLCDQNRQGRKAGKEVGWELRTREGEEEKRHQDPEEQKRLSPTVPEQNTPTLPEHSPHRERNQRSPRKETDHEDGEVVINRSWVVVDGRKVTIDVAVHDEVIPELQPMPERDRDVPWRRHHEKPENSGAPGDAAEILKPTPREKIGTEYEARQHDTDGALRQGGGAESGEPDPKPSGRWSFSLERSVKGDETEGDAEGQGKIHDGGAGEPEI